MLPIFLTFPAALTKMITRRAFWGKARQAHNDDNLIAVPEPTVYKMWDPRHLTALLRPVMVIALYCFHLQLRPKRAKPFELVKQFDI
jgi:hypothetical protein